MKLNEMTRDQIVDLLLERLSDEELAGFLGMEYEHFLELDSGEVVDNIISKVKFSNPEEIEEYLGK